MARAQITHRVDRNRVQAFVRSPAGPVARDALARGLRVEAEAKRLLRERTPGYDTGHLHDSLRTVLKFDRGPVAVIGTTVDYANLVHDGTGIYGPRGQRIYPVQATVLRFRPKGSARFIFRPSIAGMRGNPFLRDALDAGRRAR